MLAGGARRAGAAALRQSACVHSSAPASSLLYCDELTAVPPPEAATATRQGERPLTLLVVHGLLGTGRNLQTLSSNLIKQAAEQTGRPWRAVLVDQRGHGKSARLPLFPPHTLAASARDLLGLFARRFRHAGPDVVVGHSMGGKVVLELLRQLAAPGALLALPAHTWVLDALPGAVSAAELSSGAASRDVAKLLREIDGIPLPIPSRQELYKQLEVQGFSKALQQWLGSNLVPYGATAASQARLADQGAGFEWAFNLDGARSMFADYLQRAYWKEIEAPPPGTTLHIVRALQSDRWDAHSVQRLRAAAAASAAAEAVGNAAHGRMEYHEVPEAGHWVHVDRPDALYELIVPSMVAAADAVAAT